MDRSYLIVPSVSQTQYVDDVRQSLHGTRQFIALELPELASDFYEGVGKLKLQVNQSNVNLNRQSS